MKSLYLLIIFFPFLSGITATSAQLTWYRDADNDYLGDAGVSQTAASNPGGYVLNNIDCKDNIKNTLRWFPTPNGITQGKTSVFDIATRNADIYVVYTDYNNGYISVMKYNAGIWVKLGNAGLGITAVSARIAVDNAGTPYVLCRTTTGIYLYRYNGTAWNNVSTIYNKSSASNIHLAIDANNHCYILYATTFDTLNVKKFNGSSTTFVGAPSFAIGSYNISGFAVSPAGTPYVSFPNKAGGSKCGVMTYNGTAWVHVGPPVISAGLISNTSLAFDASGTLHVSYTNTPGGSTAVKKFTGGSWIDVGNPSTPPYPKNAAAFMIGKSNIPVVVSNSSTQSLYWYDGNAWQVSLFDAGITGVYALDHNDALLAAYADAAVNSKMNVAKLGLYTTPPDKPYIQAPNNVIAMGQAVTMRMDTGRKLNDAGHWQWYKGSCGTSTPYYAGDTLTDTPLVTTVYYVRAEGGCAPGNSCDTAKIMVFPVSVLQPGTATMHIELYPNPAQNLLYIKGADGCRYRLTNATGTELSTDNISSASFPIDVAAYPRGLYFIEVQKEGQRIVKKVVLQ